MGATVSADGKRSKTIDRRLNSGAEQRSVSAAKILLLGPSESGKSTIVKQMRIIHHGGYSDVQQRLTFTPLVVSNLLDVMESIVRAMPQLQLELQSNGASQAAIAVRRAAERHGERLEEADADALRLLWADAGVRRCFERRSEYQLQDSAWHFLESINRIASTAYVPSVDDVLRARQQTSGVVEVKFGFGDWQFTLVDVGGHRSERRKWLHCFGGVSAVLFVAAMSEYDQVCTVSNGLFNLLEIFVAGCCASRSGLRACTCCSYWQPLLSV